MARASATCTTASPTIRLSRVRCWRFRCFACGDRGEHGWKGSTVLVLLALWLGMAIANSITRGRVLAWLNSDDDGDDRGWSFGDALRFPRAFAQAFREATAGREELASVTLDSAESAAAVEGLLDDAAQRHAVDALRLADQIDAEPLVRALTDPRFREHKGFPAGTAYDTVCLLLEPRLEPSMLPRIAPLLEEEGRAGAFGRGAAARCASPLLMRSHRSGARSPTRMNASAGVRSKASPRR